MRKGNIFYMKKITFPLISDIIFISAAAFILGFTVINYFAPRPFSFIYAGLFSCLVLLPTYAILIKKRERALNLAYESATEKETFSALCLMDDSELLSYFASVLNKLSSPVELLDGKIVLPEKNCAIFLKFRFERASKTDVVKIFNAVSAKQTAVLFCEEANDDVAAFAARFGGRVYVKTRKEVFALIKKSGVYPSAKFTLKSENAKQKKRFRALLKKRKAKTFFTFGLTFCFLSFFVPYKTYYVVCGIFSLFFSLILRLFGAADAEKQPF